MVGVDIGQKLQSPRSIPQGLKPRFLGASIVGAKAPTYPVASTQLECSTFAKSKAYLSADNESAWSTATVAA